MIVEGKTKIVLLVQNSHKVFCYFNYSPLSIKEFEDRYGEGSWGNSKSALKLCAVEGGIPKEIRTIEIDNFADNWYIDLDRDAQDLFLKLGKVLTNGEFIAIAISNTVTTPRAHVSGDTTVHYLDLSMLNSDETTKLSLQEAAASNIYYNNKKVDENNRDKYFHQYFEGIKEQYNGIDVSSPIR